MRRNGIDKFGRMQKTGRQQQQQQQRQQQLSYTKDGDFDLQNRKLCNLKNPDDDQDCANKYYVDHVLRKSLDELYRQYEIKIDESHNAMMKKLFDLKKETNELFQQQRTVLDHKYNDAVQKCAHNLSTVDTKLQKFDKRLSELGF